MIGFRLILVVVLNVSIVGTIPTFFDTPLALPLTRNEFTYSGQVVSDEEDWDDDWDFIHPSDEANPATLVQLNKYCSVDENFEFVNCSGLHSKTDLPKRQKEFSQIKRGVFNNISANQGLSVLDLYKVWPNLASLSLTRSPRATQSFLRKVLSQGESSRPVQQPLTNRNASGRQMLDSNIGGNYRRNFVWRSVRRLNLSGNGLQGKSLPFTLMNVFPNLRVLDLRNNNITSLRNIPQASLNQLTYIDLSENPLDCTSEDLEWVDRPNITLLNIETTFCEKPPHQNKPKPILQTIRIIKKVKSECRVNCSCGIEYIWEQDKIIHSKTAVNCTNLGFMDFPDPENLPKPTDTLYLNTNQITSIEKFAHYYADVGIRNLYLENNAISDLSHLETTDWIDNFQVLSLRNNNIVDVPIHMLENIMTENKWIYLIDLSMNDWKCDCRTVSTFKVWLLRHSKFVKNIEDVRCERNKKQIRYLKSEEWCQQDEVSQMIELLDFLSIFLACCIILVIGIVFYDYWNFKKYGKIPWIVSKMLQHSRDLKKPNFSLVN